jgi:hypothetical protein
MVPPTSRATRRTLAGGAAGDVPVATAAAARACSERLLESFKPLTTILYQLAVNVQAIL